MKRHYLGRCVVDTLEPRRMLSATLLKDINVNANPANDGGNQDVTVSGGYVYFLADDGIHGMQVWSFPDTSTGTPTAPLMLTSLSGSTPSNLTDASGTVYFAETQNGGQLWKSNGTVASTAMLQSSSSPFSSPVNLINRNGTLYFVGYNSAGQSLYTSNGSNSGTTVVAGFAGIETGTTLDSSHNGFFYNTDANGRAAYDGPTDSGYVRYVYNGNYYPVYNISTPVVYFNGKDYFGSSQGLIFGTEMVNLGASAAYTGDVQTLVVFGGVLYFTGHDSSGNLDLFKINAAGTVTNVTQLAAGAGTPITEPVVVNGLMLYELNVGATGQLWRSDGTAAGTYELGKVATPVATYSSQLVLAGNEAYFIEYGDANYSNELWKTDGTAAPTFIKDIRPGTVGALANESTTTGVTTQSVAGSSLTGRVYFSADDGVHGTEVWWTDGTAANTAIVADINQTTLSSNPTDFVNFNGKTIFAASDGLNGVELWSTDGTAAGTVMLAAEPPATFFTTGLNPTDLTVFNNAVYFSGYSPAAGGAVMWSTDGTAAGTAPTSNLGSAPSDLTVIGNTLYYQAYVSNSGFGLFSTAGISGGSEFVAFGSNGGANPMITAVGQTIFFESQSSSFYDTTNLYSSNGTAAGTSVIDTFNTPFYGDDPNLLTMISYGGYLYFSGPSNKDLEMWRSNGTAAGTVLFKNFYSDPQGNAWPFDYVVAGNKLYFLMGDAEGGGEMWKTDGTLANTFEITGFSSTKFAVGYYAAWPGNLTAFGNRVLFGVSNGNGTFPAITDGTLAGTYLLSSVSETYTTSTTFNFSPDGDEAYFSEGLTATGAELWYTNGTIAGTGELPDINPGSAGSNPINITATPSGAILFAATEPTHGNELWTYNNAQDVAPLAVNTASFNPAASTQSLTISLSKLLQTDPEIASVTLANITTATTVTIPSSSLAETYDPTTSTMTVTFPGLAGAVLPAGIYRATLNAGDVADIDGNALASNYTFSFLYVPAAVKLTLASNRGLISVQQLSIQTGGLLDLTNNDLLLANGGSTGLANTNALLQSGYANGSWQGSSGIVSSTAAGDLAHLTSIGAILSTGLTFEHIATNPGDVLIKYTYYGDANLDGKLDGSDYSLIDNGYINKLTGWGNGDFNYDNAVNGSDYTLIDNAYERQGAALSATVAPATQIGGNISRVTASIFSQVQIGSVMEFNGTAPTSIAAGVFGTSTGDSIIKPKRRPLVG